MSGDIGFVPCSGVTSPDGVCAYGSPDNHCGEPAAWHFFFDSALSNGLACAKHGVRYFDGGALYFAVHNYSSACESQMYDETANRCVAP